MNEKIEGLCRLFGIQKRSWVFLQGSHFEQFYVYYEDAEYLPLSFDLRRFGERTIYIKI